MLRLPKHNLTLGDVLNISKEVVEQKNVAQEHVVMMQLVLDWFQSLRSKDYRKFRRIITAE